MMHLLALSPEIPAMRTGPPKSSQVIRFYSQHPMFITTTEA